MGGLIVSCRPTADLSPTLRQRSASATYSGSEHLEICRRRCRRLAGPPLPRARARACAYALGFHRGRQGRHKFLNRLFAIELRMPTLFPR